MLIVSRDLSARHPGRAPLSFPDLEIARGAHTLLLGPSGSGKTTLINLLTGVQGAASGSIRIDGTELTALSVSARDAFRGQHIGLVMQRLHLIHALTVKKNLLLALTISGHSGDPELISRTLNALAIGDKADCYPAALSQGEAQRVAIARAVIHRPLIVVADEPSSALDDVNCDAAIALLKAQAEAYQTTLIIATHDARLVPHFEHVVRLG